MFRRSFSTLPLALVVLIAPGALAATPATFRISSPNDRITADLFLTAAGAPRYSIALDQHAVLRESRLGLVRDDDDFSQGLRLASMPATERERVTEDYEILTAKRRVNHYVANRRTVHFVTANGHPLDIVFQVSNDGVAFRYTFPESGATVHRLKEEVTSFHFRPETHAWLQPMSVAKTGWSQVNPCYEEFYEKDIPVGTPSPLAGWVYPALFRSGETWLLVSEGSLGRNYCGTRLRAESPDGEYTIGFPDPRENFQSGAVNPESTLPWTTPWRIIAIGSLKTIMESTLGTDLSEPAASSRAGILPAVPEKPVGSRRYSDVAAVNPTDFPGKASWSWPLMGDKNTTYEVQKRFINYAAEMGWRYCLIDALWDTQIGYDRVRELVDYARTKKVRILVWENSAGDWCAAPQTPRDKMLTHESRVAEFTRLKEIGVAGLKIDFFGGDGQSMIAYYHDILEDAAPFGFVMNFHGATLPRGWNRTYPQLMTMEAVKGEEYVTFEQKNADEEPTHACMLPFGRNIFDPMDFTPVVLDRVPRIQRRTTSAFELALSVIFTSGIQHYAEIPDGMATVPNYVRDFLKTVPSVWDDSKFLAGFPGKFVVVARRGDRRNIWYVAGINGEPVERTVTLDFAELVGDRPANAWMIADGAGGDNSFARVPLSLSPRQSRDFTLKPRGGFVMVLQ